MSGTGRVCMARRSSGSTVFTGALINVAFGAQQEILLDTPERRVRQPEMEDLLRIAIDSGEESFEDSDHHAREQIEVDRRSLLVLFTTNRLPNGTGDKR